MGVTSDLIDWLPSHGEAAKARSAKAGTGPGREFVNFLWPVGLGYLSPLSPIFISEYAALEELPESLVWLARDGLIPLLWFFREFQDRSRLKGLLLVNSDLAPYVPTGWRATTGQYTLQSDPVLDREKKVRRLFLTGIMMDAYCDLAELEEKLDRICRQLGAAKNSLEDVLAFIPQRLDGFGVEHRHEYLIDYMAVLCRYFGKKIKGISWNRFESCDSWAGFAVADLNNKLICADSYLLHRAMGLGAVLVAENRIAVPMVGSAKKEKAKWIRLSPYHGLQISPSLEGKCVFDKGLPEEMTEDFERRFTAAMRSEANRRFPWPNWFAHWATGVPAGAVAPTPARKH